MSLSFMSDVTISILQHHGIHPTHATNFDLRITREDAEKILTLRAQGKDIVPPWTSLMCREYGPDEDWIGLDEGDLDEHWKLDEDWQTIELWFIR